MTELVLKERTACKFHATVDGVLIDINSSYAFSRSEIISQLREIYTEGAQIEVFCVQWEI